MQAEHTCGQHKPAETPSNFCCELLCFCIVYSLYRLMLAQTKDLQICSCLCQEEWAIWLAGRRQRRRADLQLLLSHEGEPDEGQQLFHLIKVPVRLLRPSHARRKKAALGACLQSITFKPKPKCALPTVNATVELAALLATLHGVHLYIKRCERSIGLTCLGIKLLGCQARKEDLTIAQCGCE